MDIFHFFVYMEIFTSFELIFLNVSKDFNNQDLFLIFYPKTKVSEFSLKIKTILN